MDHSATTSLAQAGTEIIRVATTGSDTPSCGSQATPCRTIQYAVNIAASGDEIRVASGVYTGVNNLGGLSQLVYISKTITVHGGYTITNAFAEPPDSIANPTTLDAQGQGRVLFVMGSISPTIEGLRIMGGNANGIGGGPFNGDDGGGVLAISAAITFSRNQIIGNTALDAGGLLLWRGTGVFSGNLFAGNIATAYGGGVGLYGGNATLSNNAIVANASHRGGGLLLFDHSTASLINNIIADNQANDNGSGVYVAASSANLFHTTIARNLGGGGTGLVVINELGPSTVAMTNTVLVSQTVGITVTVGSTVTLESTLWNDNVTNWGGAGTINTHNNYVGSPAFVDPNSGNYHLGSTSAAIDKGINAGITYDIDGDFRPQGAAPELGADEYGPAMPLLSIGKSGPVTATVGSLITYTLTVTNSGSLTATNLVITDAIPTGAAYVGGGMRTGNIVSWMVTSLPPMSSTQVSFEVTATQTITNSTYQVIADGNYEATGEALVVTVVIV